MASFIALRVMCFPSTKFSKIARIRLVGGLPSFARLYPSRGLGNIEAKNTASLTVRNSGFLRKY